MLVHQLHLCLRRSLLYRLVSFILFPVRMHVRECQPAYALACMESVHACIIDPNAQRAIHTLNTAYIHDLCHPLNIIMMYQYSMHQYSRARILPAS